MRLVQGSWAKVEPIADQAAEIFYGRLFELDPSRESMFPSDMGAQGKKLMQMLGVAVNGLTRLESIVPAVQALGKRHVGYGVKDAHYDTVGEAFIYTLDKGLGEAFTDDVQQAWLTTYGILAGTMKAAAAEVSPAPTATEPKRESSANAGIFFAAALIAFGLILAALQ